MRGQKQCLGHGKHSLSANYYSEYYCDHREILFFYQNRNKELHKRLRAHLTRVFQDYRS